METTNIARKRRSTFVTMFFLNRSKPKKNGYCPLLCRITIDTRKAQLSLRMDVDPARWDAKTGRAMGNGSESQEVNRTIDRHIAEIKKHYAECLDKNGYVTAELIKNRLKGVGQNPEMLLELFREHNAEYEKRVGFDRKKESLQSYSRTYAKLEGYIHEKYGSEDYPLRSLNQNFIEKFYLYLTIDKRQATHTVSDHLIYLKKMTRRAVNQGTLSYDPFSTYRVEQKPSPFRHLSLEDMKKVMEIKIDDSELCFIRDLFVFSCFTGLAFVDVCRLSGEHLHMDKDGSCWIRIERGKTGVQSNVRLLQIPMMIMDKYKAERVCGKIFNIEYRNRSLITPQMRRLEKLCEIPHITFHMARHNFATHITLSQGVPLTTVSRMMGHTSIRTTQIYAKMMPYKLNEDFKTLSGKITGQYTLSKILPSNN